MKFAPLRTTESSPSSRFVSPSINLGMVMAAVMMIASGVFVGTELYQQSDPNQNNVFISDVIQCDGLYYDNFDNPSLNYQFWSTSNFYSSVGGTLTRQFDSKQWQTFTTNDKYAGDFTAEVDLISYSTVGDAVVGLIAQSSDTLTRFYVAVDDKNIISAKYLPGEAPDVKFMQLDTTQVTGFKLDRVGDAGLFYYKTLEGPFLIDEMEVPEIDVHLGVATGSRFDETASVEASYDNFQISCPTGLPSVSPVPSGI